MADELNRSQITVQQTLHGYGEGHRLVAGSLTLAKPDTRTMLVLSDSSGSGVRIPQEGYLTGYPLAGAGKYVLARTWSAPEIARPGCVWTHSLLVEFADLARLVTAADLVRLFVRPSGGALSRYSGSIEASTSDRLEEVDGQDLGRVGRWLGGLYCKPRSMVVDRRKGAVDDHLMLAVWMQQWPRLRRTFRFCTLSGEDRSGTAETFDLQLIDGARSSSRSRMPTAIPASGIETEDGIAPLLDDLRTAGGGGLRRFLRDVGGDMNAGRAAMVPLVRLFAGTKQEAAPENLAGVIEDLEDLGPNQGRLAKSVAARLVLTRPATSDRSLIAFALDQVRADDQLLGIDPETVGRALLQWDARTFADSLVSEGSLREASERALSVLTLKELEPVISASADALDLVLSARPDILLTAAFWRLPSIEPARCLAERKFSEVEVRSVIAAIMTSGKDVADVVARRFDMRSIARVLETTSGSLPNDVVGPWVGQLAARPAELAACMAGGVLRSRRLLMLLVPILDPDTVPNDFGDDPWAMALHHSRGSDDVNGEDTLAAFLFCRSMGWRSRSPGRLLSLSVQRLYEALAANRLTSAGWRLTDRRLPWAPPGREWDRCERLLRAVVDRFVDKELPPAEFGMVVDDVELFARMISIASDSSRGRRYLDRVRRGMEDSPEPRWRERGHLVRQMAR